MLSSITRNSLSAIRRRMSHEKMVLNRQILGANHQLPSRDLYLSPISQKVVSFNLSDIGEGIREVAVKEWFVKVGDTVEQFDNLCEVQSDKASVTITSRYDGKIVKIYHKIDDIALVGKPLLDIDVLDEEEEASSSSSSGISSSSDEEINNSFPIEAIEEVNAIEAKRLKVLTTPAVRRIAMENKVDLSQVPATGKLGRVLKGDVLEYLGQVPPGTNKPHPTLLRSQDANQQQTMSSTAVVARVEVLKGVRKAMLKSMTESVKIPHFAYSDEIDMTNLIAFRDQLKDIAVQRGIAKLTFMPFCIKAASIALAKYPIVNSSLDLEAESIIYKTPHNISIAMDTPQGLVVPNIKNCERKSILEIAMELSELIQRAKDGTLRLNDFSDGTFSLSNIGIIGGTYTHPCIMSPQVAIGAMGRTRAVPRFGANDEIVKAHIMSVSWSADHRVIDGVTMASFSNEWKRHLENPALFILSNK